MGLYNSKAHDGSRFKYDRGDRAFTDTYNKKQLERFKALQQLEKKPDHDTITKYHKKMNRYDKRIQDEFIPTSLPDILAVPLFDPEFAYKYQRCIVEDLDANYGIGLKKGDRVAIISRLTSDFYKSLDTSSGSRNRINVSLSLPINNFN